MITSKAKTVDEYVKGFPKEVQHKLKLIRTAIQKAAPDAEESISYAMPAYKLNKKPLVYFAGYEKHIGFYATPSGHSKFSKELSKYKQGKGSVQFPLNKPLPLELIENIVKFKAKENIKKTVSPAKENMVTANKDIQAYNNSLSGEDKAICDLLAKEIDAGLPKAENKIWHAHPVWFLDGNPIAGYDKLKNCVRLLFWSGQSFDEEGLHPEGSFKAAEARYTQAEQINTKDLKRWLKKAEKIQWDYKNIVKRKGVLERLK